MNNRRTAPAGFRPTILERLVVHPVISFLYRVFLLGITYSGDRMASSIGRVGSRLLLAPFANNRRRNMRIAGETFQWAEADVRALEERFIRFQTRVFVENVRILRKRIEDVANLTGVDLIEAELRKGRGVLLVGTHFGNWAIPASILQARGIPLTCVVQRVPVRAMREHIDEISRRFGFTMVYAGENAVRACRRAFARNGVVLVMSDVSVRPSHSVSVSFGGFGMNIDPGAARLARLFGAPSLRVNHLSGDGRMSEVRIEPLPSDEGDGESDLALMRRWLQPFPHDLSTRPEEWWLWPFARMENTSPTVRTWTRPAAAFPEAL